MKLSIAATSLILSHRQGRGEGHVLDLVNSSSHLQPAHENDPPSAAANTTTLQKKNAVNRRSKKLQKSRHPHLSQLVRMDTAYECDPDVGILTTTCDRQNHQYSSEDQQSYYSCVDDSRSSMGGFCQTSNNRRMEEEETSTNSTTVTTPNCLPNCYGDDGNIYKFQILHNSTTSILGFDIATFSNPHHTELRCSDLARGGDLPADQCEAVQEFFQSECCVADCKICPDGYSAQWSCYALLEASTFPNYNPQCEAFQYGSDYYSGVTREMCAAAQASLDAVIDRCCYRYTCYICDWGNRRPGDENATFSVPGVAENMLCSEAFYAIETTRDTCSYVQRMAQSACCDSSLSDSSCNLCGWGHHLAESKKNTLVRVHSFVDVLPAIDSPEEECGVLYEELLENGSLLPFESSCDNARQNFRHMCCDPDDDMVAVPEDADIETHASTAISSMAARFHIFVATVGCFMRANPIGWVV